MKFKINKDEHEKLSDDFKALYVADGDNFIMQVEGAVDKTKLDEFRASNVDLLKQAKANEGIDMEKYTSMLETERKIRDKELIDKGDIETLIAERLANQKSDFEGKLLAATNMAGDATSKYHTLVSKTEIEGAAFKAFGATKIRPDAHDALMAQIKSTFKVEDGIVVGKNGEAILTGADGNLTIAEFVNNQPDFMRVPNSPGAGNGGDGGEPNRSASSSHDKIASGLKDLLK